ncbi:MAG: nucleoside-diphosphate kinase [Planctomycetes bacterium]|nr:nucleoside-diphosphate kinase [Planctomycetota bacterium]
MERTLILLKPDALQRRLAGRILRRFEEKGLQIVGLKLLQMDRATAESHYAPHRERPFFPGLIRYIVSSPIVALALEGRNAVALCRKMMGATFGSKAEPGTIRGDLAISDGYNLIHGSDSPEAAKEELARFFRPAELIAWTPTDLPWVYENAGGELR